MKKLFVILVALMLCYNLILAQENLFEKTITNNISVKSIREKIERFKNERGNKTMGNCPIKI